MATWLAHLRIADNLLNYGFDLAVQPFLLGNLAPDIPTISRDISHFTDDVNNNMQPERFYHRYLDDASQDAVTRAFLLGYYAHLLADVEWFGNVWRPLRHAQPALAQRIQSDSEFAYAFNRREYFGHDLRFLHANPDYSPWRIIQYLSDVPACLAIIPPDALQRWINAEVLPYYDDEHWLHEVMTCDFQYFSAQDMQAWIDCTTGTIIELFKGKRVSCPNPHPLWGAYIQPYA